MKIRWKIKNFEDCIEKVRITNKVPKKKFLNEGAYPVISQENDLINGFWDDPNDVFRVKKPVVIFGDHTKKVKYIDFTFVVGADGVKVLLPKENINSRFFYYQLKSIQIDDLGYARHYRLLKEKKIFTPPLPEQGRIVAKLDQCFEAIDKAKANVERNLNNAKELFRSQLNQIFSQKGDGWVEKRLGDVFTLEYGKPLPKEKRTPEGLYPVYGANGIKDRTNEYYVDAPSIIVGRKGSAGETNYTEEKFWPLDVTYFTKFDKNELNLDFLYHLLTLLDLPKLAKGVKPGINRNDVYAIETLIPPLPEQQRIVAKLEKLSTQTQSLESKYQQELDALDELKKSILQKAFNGELTITQKEATA